MSIQIVLDHEEQPLRGPKEYAEDNKRYEFTLLGGDISDRLWKERIIEDAQITFTKTDSRSTHGIYR